MSERKHIDVVAGAILRDGKVFGACRGYGSYAGTWEFAGGKVEPGETDEAALVREIREELGSRSPWSACSASSITTIRSIT